MPELFSLLGAAKDEGLDRLSIDDPQPDLKATPEPDRDLLRRPIPGQATENEALQVNVPLNDRRAPPLRRICVT